MMEDIKNSEAEHQINHLKIVNDKLLHRYVIARTESFPNGISHIMVSILLMGLGIWCHFEFGLNWSVIVAVCLTVLIVGLFEMLNAYPLSKGRLTITSTPDLQRTLFRYKKWCLIGTAVFLPLIAAVFLWLAFELRYVFTKIFLGFVIDDRLGMGVFVVTILLTLIQIGEIVSNTYSTSKTIDNLVAEIEEFRQ